MTNLKPEFVVKNGKPFETHFFPCNDEAKRLCTLANKGYLTAEETKILTMVGIEISYFEEAEDGILSI